MFKQRWSKPITRWFSAKAVQAKRVRRRLERKWQESQWSDRTAYRKACRHADGLINLSRRDHLHMRLLDCSYARQHWRMVKELVHVVSYEAWRTDADNSVLCEKFAYFCTSKIGSLSFKVKHIFKGRSPSASFTRPNILWPIISFHPVLYSYGSPAPHYLIFCSLFVYGLHPNITYQIIFWSFLQVNCRSGKRVFFSSSQTSPCHCPHQEKTWSWYGRSV